MVRDPNRYVRFYECSILSASDALMLSRNREVTVGLWPIGEISQAE